MSQCLECPCSTKIKCNFDRKKIAKHKKSNHSGKIIAFSGKVPNKNQCEQCHKMYSAIGKLKLHFEYVKE